MTLPKFIIGMAFVVAVVAIWSVLDSAPASTVALRAVACAVLLQVGYFIVVLAMVARQSRKPARVDAGKGAETGDAGRSAKADDLTVGRPLSH